MPNAIYEKNPCRISRHECNHRDLEHLETKVESGTSQEGLLSCPNNSALDENFLKYHHIIKKFRSSAFIWGVKHFCRNTRSWFFSSLNMGIFCQIANSPILLNISGSQDQAKNWPFFRQLKTQLPYPKTNVWPLKKSSWPEFCDDSLIF